MMNQQIKMDLKWKLLIVLSIVFVLIEQTHCLNEIDPVNFSTSSSSSEEDHIKLQDNNDIIRPTNLEKLEESDNYSTTTEETTESTKTAMDIITIVWYTSTFLALAAFFFLMACSDRRCNRRNDQNNSGRNRHDSMQCPPSPAPSYREFAPPSYESVMNKKEIYVIPITDNSIKTLPIKDNYCIAETIPTAPLQQNIETNIKIEIVNEYSNQKTG